MHEAKTHLSRLVKEVEAGEEIVVRRGDTPVAKLVAYAPAPPREPRRPGRLKGQIWFAPDWDEIPKGFEDYV